MNGSGLESEKEFLEAESVSEALIRTEEVIDDLEKLDEIQAAAFDNACQRFDWADRQEHLLQFIAENSVKS